MLVQSDDAFIRNPTEDDYDEDQHSRTHSGLPRGSRFRRRARYCGGPDNCTDDPRINDYHDWER